MNRGARSMIKNEFTAFKIGSKIPVVTSHPDLPPQITPPALREREVFFCE
jgi:hypothetical protein